MTHLRPDRSQLVPVLLAAVLPGTLTACGVRAGERSITFVFGQETAERSLEAALAFEPEEGLDLESPYGAIEIGVVPDGSPASLRAKLTVSADDQSTARAAAELIAISTEHVNGALAARLDERAAREAGHEFEAAVSWTARVPAGTAVRARTESGAILARGGLGACRLDTDYGSIELAGARGEVVLRSDSGPLTLEDVSGGPITATTDYGAIDARGLEGTSIRLGTESGSVHAERCRGERIEIGSGYGALELSRIEGQIVAGTDSGSIALAESSGSSAALSSDYGGIDVRAWRGALDARTESGQVTLAEIDGPVRADSGYGSLQIDGVLAALDARTSSGSVSIEAWPGSSVGSPWSVTTEYGAIEIAVDPALAFALDAATEYGSVDCELALGAQSRGEGTLTGTSNGGGSTVTARSGSGSIRLTRARRL
jgi:hypothetical protein